MMTELHVLQKLNDEQFSELLSVCFKFLTGKQQVFSMVVCNDQLLPNLHASITRGHFFIIYKKFCDLHNFDLSAVEPVIKSLLQISKEAVKKGKTVSQLRDDLVKLGINDEKMDIFIKQWEKEYSGLAQATAEDTISVNQLIDMEWKFGVTSASSELNTVGNVFLQLKLEIDKGNWQTEDVCLELSLPEFYSFLHEMERARASLEYLS